LTAPAAADSLATLGTSAGIGESYFKLVISSSQGQSFSYDELNPGVRILTASLNPSSKHYVGKILNTNPDKFQEMQHLLYVDLAVENEIATVASVAVLSGTADLSASGGDKTTPFRNLFGKFNTRYTAPRTPAMISQPFGSVEYDLFHFETISDGDATNEVYKVSIANIRKSLDPANLFGTFDVQVRRFTDVDSLPEILEVYPDCNLNPKDENYIARKIGDKKVYFNFDTTSTDEQRLIVEGKYPNRSSRIRIVMNEGVENQTVPSESLPFGFRGIPVLKTADALTDDNLVVLKDRNGVSLGSSNIRLAGITSAATPLSASVLPPLPFRFKVTRGAVDSSGTGYIGRPGQTERADSRYYWGVKFERLPLEATVTNAVLNSNVSDVANPLIKGYAKFQGIQKLDTLVTGSAADEFNNNKFTLARVALSNQLVGGQITDVTGTAKEHMLEAAYLRNAIPSSVDYTVYDSVCSIGSRSSTSSARCSTADSMVSTSLTATTGFSMIVRPPPIPAVRLVTHSLAA
jgi:hypothetical protein